MQGSRDAPDLRTFRTASLICSTPFSLFCYFYNAENAVAFFQVTGRLEMALIAEDRIDDFRMVAGRRGTCRAAAAYFSLCFYRSVAGEMNKFQNVAA